MVALKVGVLADVIVTGNDEKKDKGVIMMIMKGRKKSY